MNFSNKFICASSQMCTYEKHVNAPYLRKTFQASENLKKAELVITGLGFYEVFINGERITKGALAPYISSPDDIVYYDNYDISSLLIEGENVIGIMLGNGMQNSFGGYIWDFEKVNWRNSPSTALSIKMLNEADEETIIEADETFKVCNSPILFDDLRTGEYYDARLEIENWNKVGFDDSKWKNAVIAPTPRGEKMQCLADPIVVSGVIKAVLIKEFDGGYLYDFGVNTAGVCELTIDGEKGQEIEMIFDEEIIGDKLGQMTIAFLPKGYQHANKYICKGEKSENYIPRFTYHGFRYALVKGINKNQANENLLKYRVMNSDLKERGGFKCSNEIANKLQEMTRRSTLSNFYYFPTDCPHREKNGWTGDAAISAEHTLLNLQAEQSYKVWLDNIRKAQKEDGRIPGIVPTGEWGYEWGCGPAWDCVATYLPFFVYKFRGDKTILKENATMIFRYLHLLHNKMTKDGLLMFGLGDWCPPGRVADDYKAPIELTDSIISVDICTKAELIFLELNMSLEAKFACDLKTKIRNSIREKLIDFSTMTAIGNCQTSQAMAIFYNIFENGEKAKAFEKLVETIKKEDDHIDTGILGARVIFHVLSDFGRSDLAFKMITRLDWPSYGNWIARGATALWEDFHSVDGPINSLNHHFFGDISNWFIQKLAGIRVNPTNKNCNEVNIIPSFINELENAEAFHICENGKVFVRWEKSENNIKLKIEIPEGIFGRIILENGYYFENGHSVKKLENGEYTLIKE